MLQPPGASVVAAAAAADAAAAAPTIHRFRFFPTPVRRFPNLRLLVSPATSMSGCAEVVVAAAGRNTQAPRTARHHRRHSGRGRQRQSGIAAGRRRDAMRETPTTVLRMCARTLVKGALLQRIIIIIIIF